MPALVCIYMRFANCVFKKNLVEMEGFSRVYKISPPFRGSANRFSKDLLTALSFVKLQSYYCCGSKGFSRVCMQYLGQANVPSLSPLSRSWSAPLGRANIKEREMALGSVWRWLQDLLRCCLFHQFNPQLGHPNHHLQCPRPSWVFYFLFFRLD